MSNMSYCRFENTARELKECWHHWYDQPDEELSSPYERAGKNYLRKLIPEIASELEESTRAGSTVSTTN